MEVSLEPGFIGEELKPVFCGDWIVDTLSYGLSKLGWALVLDLQGSVWSLQPWGVLS